MLFKKIFISFLAIFLFFNFTNSQEIKIVSKIDDEIITNIDIDNEKKYLLLINDNLNKLSQIEIFDLAKDSLIREKVKKKEINRLFVKENNELEKKIIKNFYNRLGFTKEDEFIQFLDEKKIKLDKLKEKLTIETLWNQLIYDNYNKQVRIDKDLLKKKIVAYYNSKDKKYEYQLSEIVIASEKNINLKIKEIIKYIKQFGFKVAANKYSKSDTSKFGGNIGWIKGTRLSDNIKSKISNIKIGEISEPIQVANGYLILKINDKKEIVEKFDLEIELKQQVNYEKNRQLNQFSLNHYKKLKKNINIYENK